MTTTNTAAVETMRAALWQPANAALCERLDAFIDAAQQGDAA